MSAQDNHEYGGQDARRLRVAEPSETGGSSVALAVERKSRRSFLGRRFITVILGLALLATGALLGWALADSRQSDAGPRALVVENPESLTSVDGTEGEPVVAVARAVGPAVVRLDAQGGIGSGIIFDGQGLVVTNAHVVGSQTEVPVQLADGSRTFGQVIGVDSLVDVAVLRLPAGGVYPVAVFAPWDTVEVGQLAVAVGSPFGLEQTVTAGIVSSRSRVVDSSRTEGQSSLVEMIQTDAPINPGNSGGALADRLGRVVGMNSSVRTDESNVSNGVGFALPADTLLLIAERILSDSDSSVGYLGIDGADPASGPAGAMISEVIEGQPAALSGMQSGDLVTSFDAEPIESMAQLAAKIRLAEPGSQLVIGFLRDGEPHRVIVQLGSTVGE